MMLTALVFATVLAAEDAFNFYPNYGPLAGGTDVKFTTTRLDWRFGTAQVFFGGVTSPTVTVVSATEMHAVTPPHSEAAADVEVRLGDKSYSSFFKFGYVRPRDPLLVPIAASFPGAFGTRWTTDAWVFNDSGEGTNLFSEVCVSLGAVFPCGERAIVPAHGALQLELAARREPNFPQLYLNPPNDVASRLHFSVRVRDASRPDDIGTQIPVARRSDFRKGRLELLNVPVNGGLRSLLRIYDEMLTLHAGVTVRAFDMENNALLAQRRLEEFLPTDNPARTTLLLYDFLGTPEVRSRSSIRIEIEEDDPNAALWALLTLTDNVTQRVTVITSQ